MLTLREAREILGALATDTDEELRQRYVAAVGAHPPDRDPEAFGRIRAAYEWLSDRRARSYQRVFGPPALGDLDELLEGIDRRRGTASRSAWLAAIEEATRR